MRAFRDTPVRNKLTLIILATSAAAMIAGAVISGCYELVRARRALVNDLTAQADIIGANSAVALAFDDVQTATELLQALEARPEISQAVLYRLNGTSFAEYNDPREKTRYATPAWSTEPQRFDGGTLLLFRPLKLGNDPVGGISLRADLTRVRSLILTYAAISSVVVLGLLLLSLVMARPLQRLISEPILNLAAVAQRVTAHEDYSLRVKRHGDDEIGALTDGFNQMLEAVQERDQQLRRAYADLQSSETRFRQLAENITQVFWLTDVDKSEMLYISPAYETVWGRSCSSLYRSPQTWLESIHPEDRERVRLAALTKQAAGNYDEEYRIVLPDGSARWIRDRGVPIYNESGRVYRVGGVAEDITERKRVEDALRASERKHREFIQEATDGIFAINGDGQFTLVNPAGCAMLGYDEREVLALNIRDTYAPDEVSIAAQRLAELKSGKPLLFERRFRCKDDSYLNVEVRAKYSSDGRVQAIIRDVTERKRLEQQLLDISEREQGRIGQDLHDGLCQHLVSIAFTARNLERRWRTV